MAKAKTNPQLFNNRLPEQDKYFSGTYAKMWEQAQKGWSINRIGASHGVTKQRVQQVLRRRAEIEKMPKGERALLVLAPQTIAWLQSTFETKAVSKTAIRKRFRDVQSLMRVGVGPKTAAEIIAFAFGK